MLKRLTSRIIIGDSEKVAKNDVDEHKIRGSWWFNRRNALLKALKRNLKLSIKPLFSCKNETISVPDLQTLPSNHSMALLSAAYGDPINEF